MMLAGCGTAPARPPDLARVEVAAGRSVTVAAPGRHVTVSAGADVLPPGSLTLAPAESDGNVAAHDAVAVTAADGPMAGQVEVRFGLPGNAPADAVVGYFDEAAHRWLPVPTVRDGDRLTGTAGHLTTFGWFDDLRHLLGDLLGSRAAPPKCEARPDWVRDLIATEGADAQILVCAQASGADVDLKVVNNRAYPVALELSSAPKSSTVDQSWPDDVRGMLDRMAAAVSSGQAAVVLPPLGTVDLVYARPADQEQIITGYARVGLPSALLTVAVNAAANAGVDLGTPTVDCLLGAVSGVHDFTTRDVQTIAGAVEKFAGCAERIVSDERQALILQDDGRGHITIPTAGQKRFAALSKAKDLFEVYTVAHTAEQLVEQLVEAALDLRPAIRDGVDVTLDLRGPALALLTATSVAGVKVGGPAADAETALRRVLGAPTETKDVGGCTLGSPPTDSRHLATWGALTLITGSSGTSKGKLVGWKIGSGPLPPLVRLPYNVTTSTSVRDAMRRIPSARAEWDEPFEMYTITTAQAPTLLWSGDHQDGSGLITYITNAFEPCE